MLKLEYFNHLKVRSARECQREACISPKEVIVNFCIEDRAKETCVVVIQSVIALQAHLCRNAPP